MYVARKLFDEATGDHIATSRTSAYLRGNGGFGGKRQGPLSRQEAFPASDADLTVDSAIRPEQALIYRLSGDYHPLHVSPAFAQHAGFPRPILHGLATYGIVAHAVITAVCNGDPRALRRYRARFSNPVMPGETLRTEMWRTERSVYLQVRVVERNSVALRGKFDRSA